MRLDRIDLYQLHAIDPEVPLEEQVGALRKLRDDGKIRHVGLSNVDLEQLQRARAIVEIASVQNNYNVGNRVERTSARVLRSERHRVHPVFSARRRRHRGARARSSRSPQAHDATIWQVALAWLLQRSPAMLPIPGTSSLEHLAENVAASHLTLSEAERAALDRIAAPAGIG